MGKKANPNILRLGQTKEWKFKYIARKANELADYSFNDLETQKFINKFFSWNSLVINNYKLSQSDNFLHIFISYFSAPKIKQLINQTNNYQNVKLKLKKKESIKFLNQKIHFKKSVLFYNIYNKKYFIQKIFNYSNNKLIMKKIKYYCLHVKKFRRLNIINNYKIYQNIKTYKTIKTVENYFFLKKIIETLYLFKNKKINIILSFEQLNKDIAKNLKKKTPIKTNLIKLEKFQINNFFRTGISLLYNFMLSNLAGELITKYLAFYLKILKQHKFFLSFVKNSLKILLKLKLSNKKRVKILIKGKFNNLPRAKQQAFSVGIPPCLTLNCNINYSKAVSFTLNGTFGIKTWVYS